MSWCCLKASFIDAMKSRSKKRKASKTVRRRDRLSELPNDILVHILSFLPTQDAVRTMLLRRFGDLWTLVPSLDFQYWDFDKRLCGEDDRRRISDDEDFALFSVFVRNVLMLHKRVSIDRFELCLDLDLWWQKSEFANDVKMMLKFALDREVKELKVYTNRDFNWIKDSILPVFRSQSIVKLELTGCKIDHQNQVQLGSLKKLLLECVDVCDEGFRKLISGCPNLQELGVKEPPLGLFKLHFTAPNIEKLCLSLCYEDPPDDDVSLYCPNLKYLYLDFWDFPPNFTDVSSVRKLKIGDFSLYSDDSTSTCDQVHEFLEKFKDTEVLELSDPPSRSFSFLHLIKDLDLPQNKWKRLVLKFSLCDNNLFATCKLLKSSSHLEELVLHTSESYGPHSNVPSLELSNPCVMPHLKTITLHGCKKPYEGQLQLVEFLLKSAVILEKLIIVPRRRGLTAAQEVEFLRQLTSFRRASTNATIVFA